VTLEKFQSIGASSLNKVIIKKEDTAYYAIALNHKGTKYNNKGVIIAQHVSDAY